jgi:hypothetical protein
MTSTGRIHRVAFLVFALLIFCAAPGWSQGYERKVEVSWDFTTATTTLGWTTCCAPSSGLGLSNGALIFPATEQDWVLLSPRISVPAAPLQVVEIVMSSDTTAGAAFSWCDESEGWRESGLTIPADGSFHHYYIPIDSSTTSSSGSSSATTIYTLAVVFRAGGHVAIKSVALVTLVPSTASPVRPLWQFDKDGDFKGWSPYPYSGIVDMTVSGGRLRIKTYTDTTLLSPLAAIPNQMEWFSLSGSVTQSTLETPFFLVNLVNPASNAASPPAAVNLVPDGADHVYNKNFGWDRGDWPTASNLSITLSENTTFAIERIQLSEAPQGRADVFVDALAPTTPLVRAGTPFQFSCRVSDGGAEPVEQLSAQLTLPDDGSIRVVSSPMVPVTVQNGYPQTLTWTLVSSRAGTAAVSVTASAQVGGTSKASAAILVNPAVTPAKASYVPPPRPVSSKYDVGAYYFPGWGLDYMWNVIRNVPYHMPVQGYYAEGSPQVMDWQIKQAVEHGIKFFAVDWYWSSGLGELPFRFFNGYFASKYKSYIQFCIYSCADIRSLDEFRLVVKTWIDKYFKDPQYYRINNVPVVLIDGPYQLDTSLGGSSKQAFDAARQLAKDAGLGGIYFIASCGAYHDWEVQEYVNDGYDAMTAYNLTGRERDSNDLGLLFYRQSSPLPDVLKCWYGQQTVAVNVCRVEHYAHRPNRRPVPADGSSRESPDRFG